MEKQKQFLINQLIKINDFAVSLEHTKKIISKLNLNLTPKYPIILIGGTNGKGSTCAYLTNILSHSSYKVGTFTSPHIFEYNERISINNISINDEMLIETLKHIIDVSENSLGLFKTFTLAAHKIFEQQQIDIAIIEVGLGGNNDVTNLFEPTISAITNVDFDHCEILGNTLDAIGLEKAGIFRKNKWGFFGSKNIPNSIINYTNKINTNLQIFGRDFYATEHELSFDFLYYENSLYSIPYPGLRGAQQINNVCLALAILTKLPNFPVSINIIKTALLQTKLLGRFQLLPGIPQIVLDVAHNSQAVSIMLKNMVKLPMVKNNYAVFGIAKEKDIASIIGLCKDKFTKWFIAKINSPRGVANSELLPIFKQHNILEDNIIECINIKDAFIQAKNISSIEDRIVCFGSFLVIEEVNK